MDLKEIEPPVALPNRHVAAPQAQAASSMEGKSISRTALEHPRSRWSRAQGYVWRHGVGGC
jgi:hypothetical protein